MDNPSFRLLERFCRWRRLLLIGGSHQPATERDHVRNFIEFIEDRRVLYSPYFLEYPSHVVASVQQIETEARRILSVISPASKACASIRKLHAACTVFLGRTEIAHARSSGVMVPARTLFSAVMTVREILTTEAAELAGDFALDLPPELALISSKRIRVE